MNKEIETYHIKDSALLIRADYDHLMGNMKLYFRQSGDVYEFVGVPYEVYEELKNAESAGKFFHTKIKPLYEHLRMTKKTTKKLEENNSNE